MLNCRFEAGACVTTLNGSTSMAVAWRRPSPVRDSALKRTVRGPITAFESAATPLLV